MVAMSCIEQGLKMFPYEAAYEFSVLYKWKLGDAGVRRAIEFYSIGLHRDNRSTSAV